MVHMYRHVHPHAECAHYDDRTLSLIKVDESIEIYLWMDSKASFVQVCQALAKPAGSNPHISALQRNCSKRAEAVVSGNVISLLSIMCSVAPFLGIDGIDSPVLFDFISPHNRQE